MTDSFLLILKSVFVLVGIGGGVFSLYTLMMSNAAKTWLPVKGAIDSHGFWESRDNDGGWMYEASVTYTYEFRGRKYQGKRIAFGFSSWNIKWLVQGAYRAAIARAPKVIVRVNPRHPTMSSILYGTRSFHVANLLFFIFWNVAIYKIFSSG